jgi:methanogenic corrinoid protein MtbC1
VPVNLHYKPVYFTKWYRTVGKKVGKDLGSQLEAQLEFFQQWPEVVPLLTSPSNQGAIGLLHWLGKRISSETPPPSQHWSLETLKEKLKSAEVPDPARDAWMPGALEDWQQHVDHLPSETRTQYGGLLWTLQVPGPLSALGTLLSYPDTFRLLYDDPDLVHELFELHTMSLIPWVQAVDSVFSNSGLTPQRLFMYEEMLPMVSPDHAKEFCLPYARRIFGASKSPMKILHCDNRVGHMPEVVTGFGANVFFGNFSNYAELKGAFGGKMALMGNVPSLYVLTEGGPKDVEECCKWLISQCGSGGGFILSSGGGFDPTGQTPFENTDAMVKTAEKYGRYPVDTSAKPAPDRYSSIMSMHFSSERGEIQSPGEIDLDRVMEQTCQGNVSELPHATKQAMEKGIAPESIFLDGLCQGLRLATNLFYQEEYFHPEVDRADQAFHAGLAALGSSFSPHYYKGTVVIGTIKGSYQGSGISLIEVMLRGGGLNVISLGVGVGPERFIDEAVKAGAQVIAMGVYFIKHAKLAEEVTSRLKERGLDIKTLAGGMGITPNMAETLKVDAHASDGRQARDKALAMIGD